MNSALQYKAAQYADVSYVTDGGGYNNIFPTIFNCSSATQSASEAKPA